MFIFYVWPPALPTLRHLSVTDVLVLSVTDVFVPRPALPVGRKAAHLYAGFSRMILAEVRRTHVEKLCWGEEITASGFAQLRWDEEIAEGTERGRVF